MFTKISLYQTSFLATGRDRFYKTSHGKSIFIKINPSPIANSVYTPPKVLIPLIRLPSPNRITSPFRLNYCRVNNQHSVKRSRGVHLAEFFVICRGRSRSMLVYVLEGI
ncbi:hypothetical protein LXL04_039690 [Taraxacum kok-saghyz]